LFCRFPYHAVTCRQCGRQFPARHWQWEAPRNDLTNNAQRLMEVLSDGIFVDFTYSAFLSA
jgi:hypothetical protein